jgi:hypothetical protein
MSYTTALISLIERAESAYPTCHCGQAMAVAERDGALWLECVTLAEPAPGFVGKVRSIFGHDRRLLLAAEELAA